MGTPVLETLAGEAPAPPPMYIPEDLLLMPDGHRFDLVDGKLVARNMGAESSQVAGNVLLLIGPHVRARKLGKVFPTDCGYQCFPNAPKKVRFADGSFIAHGRLTDERTPKGHIRIAPDLAVEVVSPNDTALEVEEKRVDYLTAGVRLVWIIYPEFRSVHVHRLHGGSTVLSEKDELLGDEVLPDFRCKVAELFEDL